MGEKNERRVAGLDLGTGNIKLSVQANGKAATYCIRNAFYAVPNDQSSREMLKRLKAPVFEVEGRTYLAGNEAFELAKIFGKELRRPMQSGVINASVENEAAVPMIGSMIERIMKEAGDPGKDGVCAYSCPADPVDLEIDSVLHRALIEGKLKQLGWTPKLMYEGHGVVLSELETEDFTGIGFSFGAGMVNVCVAYRSLPVITFSSCHSGDWIDLKVSQRLRVAAPRVSSIKEDPKFDLRKTETLEHITVGAYYREIVQYALEHVQRRFEAGRDIPRFEVPIPIVIAGGTAKVAGFIEMFREVFEKLQFPIPVKEIRLAKDPIFAVSRGALVCASL